MLPSTMARMSFGFPFKASTKGDRIFVAGPKADQTTEPLFFSDAWGQLRSDPIVSP